MGVSDLGYLCIGCQTPERGTVIVHGLSDDGRPCINSKCSSCEELRQDTCMRDGTGDPGAPMCDDCHAEYKRNDMEPVQW